MRGCYKEKKLLARRTTARMENVEQDDLGKTNGELTRLKEPWWEEDTNRMNHSKNHTGKLQRWMAENCTVGILHLSSHSYKS